MYIYVCNYKDNPSCGWTTCLVFCFLIYSGLGRIPLVKAGSQTPQGFGLLVAALCHDIGHPGHGSFAVTVSRRL